MPEMTQRHEDSTTVTMQALEPDVLLPSELSALADFLQRIQPVIDYLEAEKDTLPPRLRALLESDSEAECELSPSEVTALLRQYVVDSLR